MLRSTVLFYWSVIAMCCAACMPAAAPLKDSVHARAVAFLWQQQSSDGRWHSNTHTILRDGLSLTPYVLYALLQVPEEIFPLPHEKAEAGINAIRADVQASLSDSSAPLILDYPNYSAAFALLTLRQFGSKQDSFIIGKLTEYLIAQQFVEHRGIFPGNVAYGGWGFGETNLSYGQYGHVDISHTRKILEALKGELPQGDSVFIKAKQYLDSVQNDHAELANDAPCNDGGFFTSLATPMTNKSHEMISGSLSCWGSYATATCDGLLARLACGQNAGDLKVARATAWLTQHDTLRYPQGIPLDDPEQWHRVMHYYHLAVRGEAAFAFPRGASYAVRMQNLLSDEQHEDGSFLNPDGAANKENDPILATCFAVIALNGVTRVQVDEAMGMRLD